MNATVTKTNLLGLTRAGLEAFVAELGEKPFRARQLMKWLYKRRVGDFEQMTDLAKSFRLKLKEVAEVAVPAIRTTQVSADGTRKWLLAVPGGTAMEMAIEMVFIPEPGRGTLCISSQVGCAMDCTFCSTAQQGFNRNLTAAEIVGQVWLAYRELTGGFAPEGKRSPEGIPRETGWPAPEGKRSPEGIPRETDRVVPDTSSAVAAESEPESESDSELARDRIITNVVFMGMGEPLANYRNVVPAVDILMDDLGFDISRRRVTVSTSGLVPQMLRLAEETNCALAVSLHAPNDQLRDQLVPINRKHPIADLLDACWIYANKQNARSITFEYVMLDGINDRPEHAHELVALLKGRPAKLNLIPFNPFPNTRYRRSAAAAIERFRDILNANGVIATTRRTRGDDIDAACGQLVGRVHDRTTVRLGSKLVSLAVQP